MKTILLKFNKFDKNTIGYLKRTKRDESTRHVRIEVVFTTKYNRGLEFAKKKKTYRWES